MVVEALNSGKNVYVEKPLSISLEGLKAIYNAYVRNNKTIMVGYNRRFSASINYLKEQLKNSIPYSVY